MSTYEIYFSVNGRYGRMQVGANTPTDAAEIVRSAYPGAIIHGVKKIGGP